MSFLKNRTVVGVICILLSLLICFGLTPLFNQSVSQKAEIVRVIKRWEGYYGSAVSSRATGTANRFCRRGWSWACGAVSTVSAGRCHRGK